MIDKNYKKNTNENKIISQLEKLAKHSGIDVNSTPILINYSKYFAVAFEVPSEISKQTKDLFWKNVKEELNYIMVFDKLSIKKNNVINIIFLTREEIEMGVFYDNVLLNYDYANYNRKKFNNKSMANKKFINAKRLEFLMSNIAFKHKLIDKNEKKLSFNFKIKKIYLEEIFYSKNFLLILDGFFAKRNFKEYDLYFSGINLEPFNEMFPYDPVYISKFQNIKKISIAAIKDSGRILNENELNEFANEMSNEIRKDYSPDNVTMYNLQLENYLEKMKIIQREFLTIAENSYFNRIVDQNIETFFYNGKNLERFIQRTFLIGVKDQIKLLMNLSDIMRYIDSEYKKLVKPIVFSIEDFLIDLTLQTILELMELNLIKTSVNFYDQIKYLVEPLDEDKESIPLYMVLSEIVKLTQKKNSKTCLIKTVSSGPNNFKDNWKNLRYFAMSEISFKDELNIAEFQYSNLEFNEIVGLYFKSNRFKFDLNFVLRKLSFSNLINFISTLDLDDLEMSDNTASSRLLKEITSNFDKDEFELIKEIRNASSHQDILFNSLNFKIPKYESVLYGFHEIMKKNYKLQSYSFQATNDIDLKSLMDSKIWGLINYYKKQKKNKFNTKFEKLITFVDLYYDDLFDRKLIKPILENEKSYNEHRNAFQSYNETEISLSFKNEASFDYLNEYSYEFYTNDDEDLNEFILNDEFDEN